MCAACGTQATSVVGGIWLCQRCIDAMAHHDPQPVMSTDNPDSLDVFQRWLDGLRDRKPRPGKERNQEPVQLAPLPPYAYPSVPGGRSMPDTPRASQLVRDPEPVIVPELPEREARKPERERAPVSTSPHSPTPIRTQPFLPAHHQEPVQSAPVTLNHPAPVEQQLPPPYSVESVPETITPKGKLPPADTAPKENYPSNITPKNYPGGKFGEKFQGGNSQPGGNFSPGNTTKPFTKQLTRKGAGRQRGKDRGDEDDGVRQMFELWWRKGESRGDSFGQFYRNHISVAMCKYYRRYYIRGENPKSAADYTRWRAEWEASHTS